MHLVGHDYYSDTPDTQVGLSRTATLIKQARAEVGDALTLLVDNGDSLQGTPLGEITASGSIARHPLMQAFDMLEYDAIGLGNHDFNFGLDALDKVLAQAPCPVVCSNLRRLDGQAPWVPHLILDRHFPGANSANHVRIGLFSVLPPQTIRWDSHLLEGRVDISEIVPEAHKAVETLRDLGCDVVIALAHSGLCEAHSVPNQENAVIPLAAIPGVDAVIAGHTHQLLPGKAHQGLDHVDAETGMVHGKPVVMPGFAGSHLGCIDLELIRDETNSWQVHRSAAVLRSVISPELVQEASDLAHLFEADHVRTRQAMKQTVGHTDHSMHSFFSFCAPDRSLAKIAAAQAAALRTLLADSPAANLPLLSACAPLKFGGRAGPHHFTHVPAGPLTVRNIADLQIYPNELRALVVTGAQVSDWLEMSASLFNQVYPGNPEQTLISNQMPGHNFDVIHGVTYEIDPSVPARFNQDGALTHPNNRRVRNLRWNNQPIIADQTFVVALGSYRAGGGGNFRMLETAQQIRLPSVTVREALQDYIVKQHPRDPLGLHGPSWRFVRLPEVQVVMRTGPEARTYLSELDDYDVRDLGLDDDGFLVLSLTL